MIQRDVSKSIMDSLNKNKSVLLIGPRQTGKSTLIKNLKPDLSFNLSDQNIFIRFLNNPDYLQQHIKGHKISNGIVFIDEVQRIPSLLNTIQSIVDENKKIRFILTGSSARKLKRGHANLLPGRIHDYRLGPITAKEMNYKFDIQKALSYGSLPEVVTENETLPIKKLLKSYTQVYLTEEIKAEALTKNLEGFTRFIYNIAIESTHFLDLSKISKAIAVPRQTTQRYFEILEDTLIIHRCEAFAKSDKRRLIQHPRFFIFDNGVLNALIANFNPSADRMGLLFENLVFNQMKCSLENAQLDYRISSYRTSAGAEVDFILELENKIIAIEVKSSHYSKSDYSAGFKSFEDFTSKKVRKIVIHNKNEKLKNEDVEMMSLIDFLKDLGI